MPVRTILLIPLLSSIGCFCSAPENNETLPLTQQTAKAKVSKETVPVKEETESQQVQVRALFYMERTQQDDTVKGWPINPGSPTVGPGEQAWLEVHTNGASHAYAFALFADGRVSTLWQEKIRKLERTPPMNAFGDGLGLSADFEKGAKLLVVASREALDGLADIGDCSQPNPLCAKLKDWRMTAADDTSNHVVQMKQGEIRVPAYGRMSEGPDRAVIQFGFMDADR
jgi:hypothetical protein